MNTRPFIRSTEKSSPIARLPAQLINQIAAGEVVERPASVIKELVENSLDAGADRVEVALTDGGIAQIQVLDNGHGIPAEEMELALERHATSKIRSETDLSAILTFGFRGEALAAIASVAEVELKSRTRQSAQGYLLKVAYGDPVTALRPVGMPEGTQISVTSLFAKLPARQKYLRAAQTEYSHCARLLREIALGIPETRFTLRHQSKVTQTFAGQDRLSRLRECLTPSWDPIGLSDEAEGLRLEAYLSPPDIVQDRGELFLFINGRAVRHRGFLAAIRNAYANVLGPHHDPSGVIHLDMRPDWVDVNVHPQKWEVRCLRQERLYGWLTNLVKKLLATTGAPARSLSERFDDNPGASHFPPSGFQRFEPTTPGIRYLGHTRDFYLIAEDKQGLFLLDPRAFHENLLYGKLVAENRSQALAAPKIIALPVPRHQNPEAALQALANVGFEAEPFGENTVLLKTIPELCDPDSAEKAFLACFEQAPTSAEGLFKELVRQIAMNPRAPLSAMQAQSLLASLNAPGIESWTCPHGRPILFRINQRTLNEHFGRSHE